MIDNTKMQPSEVKTYRSVANQALYAAQYIAERKANELSEAEKMMFEQLELKPGDKRYLQAINKYFISTDAGLQPAVIDIRDYVVNGSDKLAESVFAYCAKVYSENASLINAWINR